VLFVATSAWSLARFSALPMRVSDRRDHAEAALPHSTCRQAGIQAGTIDVLLAQLCIRHRLVMLTTDEDFMHIAGVAPLDVWRRSNGSS
jgi:predicted nucleic acid-binding protein